MKREFKNVTVLLPAMNETYSLRETVETILKTCKPEDIAELILLLSKKSTIECIEVAEKLCEQYKNDYNIFIHYQTLPFVGGAVREGIKMAKGSHLILMSTDLETDPKLVCRFIEEAKKSPDYIITASRWMKGCSFKGYSKIKLICNFIFQKMVGILYGTRLTDLTYAFRIFPTDLMKRIHWEELKHPFFVETALKPLRLKVKFLEIPASWKARTEGESQNSFFANFRYFGTVWHVRFCPIREILEQKQTT